MCSLFKIFSVLKITGRTLEFCAWTDIFWHSSDYHCKTRTNKSTIFLKEIEKCTALKILAKFQMSNSMRKTFYVHQRSQIKSSIWTQNWLVSLCLRNTCIKFCSVQLYYYFGLAKEDKFETVEFLH